MKITHIAETDRVKLVPITPDDVTPEYLSWMQDPVATRYLISKGNHTFDTIKKYIERTIEDPSQCMWRIMYKEADGGLRHIGNAKLTDIKWQHRNAYISYMIGDKKLWGKGIGPNVAYLVTKFAFDELNLHKVYGNYIEENIGARISVARVGYRVEAFFNEDGYLDGKPINTIVMSIFKGQLKKYE